MKKPLLCIYKIITAIFFISIIVTPSISEGADILKMLIWEGYFPHKQVEKFEALIKKKYGKEVRLEISHNVSDIQNFYDGIRSKSYHIISPAHNIIKDFRFGYIKKKLIIPVDLKNIPNDFDGMDLSHMIQNPTTKSPRTSAFWKYGNQWVVRKGKRRI